VGFHAGISWLRGGYLPITTFFVLSGFLITALLLLEVGRDRHVSLGAFWGARARRLVPAAVLGLVLAGLVSMVTPVPSRVGGDAISALFWMANWRFIVTGLSYATLFSHPSPVQHYWSLAVEEQFYIVLPLLAVATLVWFGKGRRVVFAATAAVLLVASIVATRVLHDPGQVLRTYYGTDTRAAELLVGVLLAIVMVGRDGVRVLGRAGRTAVDGVGLVALVVTVALWCIVRQFDDRLLDGGLVLVALLAAAVVLAAIQPGTLVSKILAVRPLAWLGRISYGAYVYHWPLFLLLSPERTGLTGIDLLAVRVSVALAAATLSYHYIELPIRERRLPRPVAAISWANAAVVICSVFAVVAAGLPSAHVSLRADGAPPPPPPPPVPTTVAAPLAPTPVVTASPSRRAEVQAQSLTRPTTPPVTAPPPPPPVRVLVFGDSLAENLATGLIARAAQTHDMVVWDHGIPGCPISRGGTRLKADGSVYPTNPICPWWGTDDGRKAVADFHADVVLVAGGLNDLFDRQLPQWSETRHIDDPIFDPWLLSEYDAAFDTLSVGGAHIVWTTPPCFDTSVWGPLIENAEARRRYHNSTILPMLAAARPVQLADLNQELCPTGTFDPNSLGMTDSRPDGLHLTDAASDSLADSWLAPLLLRAAGR